MAQVSEVVKIRRNVLAEVSSLAFGGALEQDIHAILETVVTEDGPRYRCCVHKERAVLEDRINMALNQPVGTNLKVAAARALAGHKAELPIVNVLPEACDRCPIDKFLVTDACRNCLAHSCIASCPKKAIMVVQNRAYIDKARCVECGLCKRSCSYGAIIEISRPCERACDLKAITAGADRRAVINYEKCVECGSCKVACPFGAISDPSDIVQLIRSLKQQNRVYAVLAPAFVGQLGIKVLPEQVMAALKLLGFHAVTEAAFGADAVVNQEVREFAERMRQGQPFMTTSCCPAFVSMVEKHLPDQTAYISSTVSPMAATAAIIKATDPAAQVAFIGPCIAKKGEARRYNDLIDYVLTFEELAAMLVGANINVAEVAAASYEAAASRDGTGFARAGGVTQAIGNAAAVLAADVAFRPQRSEGLANCKAALQQLKQGLSEANFCEGMACTGGCVGGPGCLADHRATGKLVESFAGTAKVRTAPENAEALAAARKILRRHRQ